MKVLTFSRHFPSQHIRKSEPTFFIEQILNTIMSRGENGVINRDDIAPAILPYINDFVLIDGRQKKLHTIRAGTRWKAGDMASLRVWSDKPYRSKQIEFAQVEVTRVYPVDIYFTGGEMRVMIDGNIHNNRELIARNDGLKLADFIGWFQKPMDGQIICWHDPHY